ncbi:hypothetical protein C0993_003555, partial [Termitomyces sp. T159_Od127]
VLPAMFFDNELEALLADDAPIVVSLTQKDKEAIIVPLVEQDVRQQEQFWKEVVKESWEDTQRHVSKALEALFQEGMGLGKAIDAGKGLEQQQEREEGAKEKMPEDLAGAAVPGSTSNTQSSCGWHQETSIACEKFSILYQVSLQAQRVQGTKAPTQSEFTDKELASLLVPKQPEAVVNMRVEAKVVLKETKEKAMMDLATH